MSHRTSSTCPEDRPLSVQYHTCQGVVMSHVWRSHVTRVKESCHTFEWVMSYMTRDGTLYIHIYIYIYICVCVCVCIYIVYTWRETGLYHLPHIPPSKRAKSYLRMSRVTTILNESCHPHEQVVSHIWMSHVTHMNKSCYAYEWVMSQTYWMSRVTHTNESCHTHEWVMSRI